MLATWVKTPYTKFESKNCFIIHSKYFQPQNMLNKKRYRMKETSSEDKIDRCFGFSFKIKKCQVDKLHIFIYVNLQHQTIFENLSNWYFLILNIASLKMISKRRSIVFFTCFSITKTCLTLCKNFFFKTFVIVWLFPLDINPLSSQFYSVNSNTDNSNSPLTRTAFPSLDQKVTEIYPR